MDIKKGYYIVSLIFLTACAQIMPLDGGNKDVHAPAVDSATTIPYNGIVNYRGQEFQIGFNEYIRLNNPKENILITPIPDTVPDFKVKNKLFFINFVNKLKPETTYSIFIDGAIEDITEGNDSLYQFVFSTGDHIDTAKVSGSVKHAFSNQPAKEILVGLYPNKDSAVFKYKPTYIARTDESGKYTMSYIKPGTYRLFALNDANKTFTVDQIQEQLAFKEDAITVKDSSYEELVVYPQEDLRQLITKNEYKHPGKVTLVFNQETSPPIITSKQLDDIYVESTAKKDSFTVWLPPDTSNVVQLFVETETLEDTFTVDRYVKKGTEKKIPLTFTAENKGVLGPGDTLQITASMPIDSIDYEKIYVLFKDTTTRPQFFYNTGEREFNCVGEFQKDSSYVVVLDSASVFDIYGNTNDSTAINVEQKGNDYYGKLIVSFDSLAFKAGFLEVLQNDEVIRQTKVSQRIEVEHLTPGNYELRMIDDKNNNGKWDTGNYGSKRQPEKVIYHNQTVSIKSNWDMEIKWEIKKKPPPPKKMGLGRP